mmetsp:Transcript_67670/g.153143  ORF Transcript_67670/g.153143 Transcript_67670/m.153143 type:complete len:185 (-) Transcript_67670:199-753(-)
MAMGGQGKGRFAFGSGLLARLLKCLGEVEEGHRQLLGKGATALGGGLGSVENLDRLRFALASQLAVAFAAEASQPPPPQHQQQPLHSMAGPGAATPQEQAVGVGGPSPAGSRLQIARGGALARADGFGEPDPPLAYHGTPGAEGPGFGPASAPGWEAGRQGNRPGALFSESYADLAEMPYVASF